MWITLIRRVMFFLVLLVTGAVTVSCFHFTHNGQWVRTGGGTPSPGWIALGTFAWGADSLGYVLAAWLAGRSRVWTTWSGRLRAAIYLLAYTYGRMLFSATQDWLIQPVNLGESSVAFRWPGALLQDYARPALDLLTLLVLVWLFVPVFTVTRSALAGDHDQLKARGTFSIASILGWTTVAAIILLWIRFLTWEGLSPRTMYTNMTPTKALTEYFVEYMPSLMIVAATILLLVWGWSGRWWLALIALAGALLLDSFGHKLFFAILEWVTGKSRQGNVLTGSALEHWSFIAGSKGIVWTVFGVARLTGVRLRRSPPATDPSKTGHLTPLP